MPPTRCLIEIGCGVDLHGSDSTKAAKRAVVDAFARNNVSFYSLAKTFRADPASLQVEATIGVPNPESVNRDSVMEELPKGKAILNIELKVGHSATCGELAEAVRGATVAARL